MDPDEAGEFSGKVIAVYCRHDEGGMFRDARIEHLGGRAFLVGRFAARATREWDDIACWLALDEVVKILVFDSIEEARTLFAKGEAMVADAKLRAVADPARRRGIPAMMAWLSGRGRRG
jgi:hypothetical protein